MCPHSHNVTTAKSVIKSAHGLYPIASHPSSYQLELGLGTFQWHIYPLYYSLTAWAEQNNTFDFLTVDDIAEENLHLRDIIDEEIVKLKEDILSLGKWYRNLTSPRGFKDAIDYCYLDKSWIKLHTKGIYNF